MLGRLFGRSASRLKRAFERAARSAPEGPLSEYYRRGMACLEVDAKDAQLVAIDLETDGLDTVADAILEAGLISMTGHSIDGQSASRFRFQARAALNPKAVVIHRITDDQAAHALPESEALAAVLDRCAGKVLVAHFAEIEAGFLDAACKRVFGAPFVAPMICTMQLETRWFPRGRASDGLRLGKLRSSYGLPTYRAHDGLTDALACGELLLAQLARADRAGTKVSELLRR